MLEIGMLGPLRVRRAGQPISVPRGKPSEVLLRLAIQAGTPLRMDALIEQLWWETAGRTSRNTVQAKVSALRRVLGPDAVIAAGGGYVLAIDPANVDALRVATVAGEARAALTAGDARRAEEQAREGELLFRGDPLVDAGDAPWVEPYRAELAETQLDLIEIRVAAQLQQGAGRELVGELEHLVASHPLRESLWAALITALYRDDRQADALAAYRRIRALLADEVGVDPGPELRALEARVLQQNPDLSGTPREPRAASDSVGNLPGLVPALIGRDADVAELTEAVRTDRLVTLTGPSGVGKTRLAIEAGRTLAADFPDGVWMVDLADVAAGGSLTPAVGDALGIVGANDDAIRDRLRIASALIIVDNCEHVLDSAATLVQRLLDAAPTVRILATSQALLGLPAERIFALDPLAPESAVALFAERAGRRRRSFALDDAARAAVDELCRSLDGLPLAIELAAARMNALSVQEIAQRLEDRFGLLRNPADRTGARHQALGNALAWSYDLLFPDEQVVLQALSFFRGGAPLAAVEHVAAALGVPTPAVLDVVGRLVDRSLVILAEDQGAARYRLLESVREFAAARSAEATTEEPARRAHAEWIAAQADSAATLQRGPDQPKILAQVVAERANIDAALAWTARADPPLGVRIALGFGWASVVVGEGQTGATRVRRAAEIAASMSVDEQIRADAYACWNQAAADVAVACADGQRAVERARAADDPLALGFAACALAFALTQAGKPGEALATIDDWRSRCAQRDLAPTPWDVALGSVFEGYAGVAAGDLGRIRSAVERAEPLLPDLRDGWMTSHIAAIAGQLALVSGDPLRAQQQFQRAVDAALGAGCGAAAGFHRSPSAASSRCRAGTTTPSSPSARRSSAPSPSG